MTPAAAAADGTGGQGSIDFDASGAVFGLEGQEAGEGVCDFTGVDVEVFVSSITGEGEDGFFVGDFHGLCRL